MGAEPFTLADEHRVLYHAAAVVASNYLVTLASVAEDLFERAGLPAGGALPAFLPLMRGALDNLQAQGTVAALTGPLSRGDVGTVAAHLDALGREAPGDRRVLPGAGPRHPARCCARGQSCPPRTIDRLDDLLASTAADPTNARASSPRTTAPSGPEEVPVP